MTIHSYTINDEKRDEIVNKRCNQELMKKSLEKSYIKIKNKDSCEKP